MTVSTSASTPAGTYSITVTGTGASATHATTFTLVVNGGGSGGTTWAAGVNYNVGDTVTYNGVSYRCLQAHLSQSTWTPDVVPALWQRV